MKRKIFSIVLFILFLLTLTLYLTNNVSFIDTYFYNLIISLKSSVFTKFMKFITLLASTKFIIIIVIILFIVSLFKSKIPLIINGLVIGESIINNILKIIIKRKRPTLINLVVEKTYSFPSGHTMVAVVLYGFLEYLILRSKLNKLVKILLILLLNSLILLIMISRIYLGAHYFTDVIGGMFLGISYLLLVIDILESREIL